MKLTKETLKRIIKEELDATLNEMEGETPENPAIAVTETEMTNIIELLKGDPTAIEQGLELSRTLELTGRVSKQGGLNFFTFTFNAKKAFSDALKEQTGFKVTRRDGGGEARWEAQSGPGVFYDVVLTNPYQSYLGDIQAQGYEDRFTITITKNRFK